MAKADAKVKYHLLVILIEPSRGVVAGAQQVIHQLLLRFDSYNAGHCPDHLWLTPLSAVAWLRRAAERQLRLLFTEHKASSVEDTEASLHHLGVVEGPAVLHNLFTGLLQAQTGSVGTVGEHGFNHI
jgi:hypothetical protein